jgi:aryl-alcohol dehydrogenase-like predicted oxidoreductase
MIAVTITQKPPSRLMLGSAQFGLNYGLANTTGQPSYETVREIIRIAHAGGVDIIDTAPFYGSAEEWIGRALRELGISATMRVETKIAAMPDGLRPAEAARLIEQSLTRSLKLLGLEQIPVCLFHRQENIEYADELLAVQARGLIEVPGVSLAHPEWAHRALKIPGLRAWQIPSSLLDRRYTHSGLTAAASTAGIVVFARSSFLQGLLLLNDETTPPYLRAVNPVRRQLREIGTRFGLPMEALAIRWILSRNDIRSVVVGMEALGQIEENVTLFAQDALPPEVIAAVTALEPNLPAFVVSPPDWAKAKAEFEASSAKTP